jgi:hypothetical protein
VNLFELVKVMVQETSGFYARALRVIGQDLARLVPENLAIEHLGNDLIAHGLCSKSRMDELTAAGSWTGVKKLVDKVADIIRVPSHEPDLEFVPFTRSYTAADIERLDGEGTQQRGDASGMPDIYSLGERLRTIGKVIDAQNGRVMRIFKDLHRVVFEYQSDDGKARKEELNNTELYQLQQRYAAGRDGTNAPKSSKE